jgi:mono/diheme cytochrome c family protein
MDMRNAMKPLFLMIALAAAAAPASAQSLAGPAGREATRWGMLDTYCGECHNATDWAGGVAFDTLTPADVTKEIDVWEHTVRKLRGHLMPPPGSKQPTQAEKDDLVGWLETRLDARKETPRAQYVTAQRLNRTEYANAVRTLLGVEVKVNDLLPPEVEMEGFDNIAASLTVSPAFLDQYINAARYVSARAVGSAAPKMGKATYGNQGGGVMPLGSRGGVRFKHYFPADGEYRFSVVNDMTGSSALPNPSLFPQTVVMFLDGKEVFRGTFGGKEDLGLADREGVSGGAKVMARFRGIPVKVPFGMHEIVFTTMERAQVLSDTTTGGGGPANGPGGAGAPAGGPGGGGGPSTVEVSGPYGPTTFSAGSTRDRIFVCDAKTEAEERPCAEKIARHLATQAYRRPATDADVARLMGFYASGRKDIGNFNGGVQEIVMAVISSPDFLYRTIQPRKDPKKPQPLTALELASRLSFFLWSDLPDAELRQVAVSGKLTDPAVYEKQVLRMLADKRASALVTSFAMRWLNVDDLDSLVPDPELYRGFTPALRDDFSMEMQLFLSEVLLENKSVLELLSADYTYVNRRLADHYGIRGLPGTSFRRVQLTDANRFGLLGKAAVLLRTSYPDRTSPVLRGAWVLEKLLNTMTSPPPPGVETDLNAKAGTMPTTLRGRLEVHRSAKSCNQCHGVIDPIGLAMENFDAVGAYRARDNGIAVDSSTVMPNGVAISGMPQLREWMLARPDQFVQTMVQKLMMFGTGREVEADDMPQVRQIVRNVKPGGYRFFDLVMGVVKSDAFRLQGLPHAEEGANTSNTVAAAAAR